MSRHHRHNQPAAYGTYQTAAGYQPSFGTQQYARPAPGQAYSQQFSSPGLGAATSYSTTPAYAAPAYGAPTYGTPAYGASASYAGTPAGFPSTAAFGASGQYTAQPAQFATQPAYTGAQAAAFTQASAGQFGTAPAATFGAVPQYSTGSAASFPAQYTSTGLPAGAQFGQPPAATSFAAGAYPPQSSQFGGQTSQFDAAAFAAAGSQFGGQSLGQFQPQGGQPAQQFVPQQPQFGSTAQLPPQPQAYPAGAVQQQQRPQAPPPPVREVPRKPPASPWEINPNNPVTFFTVQIQSTGQLGRLCFELFHDAVPKTATNFHTICLGTKHASKTGELLTYKNSRFHRVIKNFVCQGGNITQLGGESIYGGTFEDESFTGKAGQHWGLGTMSMANHGPNTNGSQYSLCVDGVQHLNGVHVVFGQIVMGLEFLIAINSVPVGQDDEPVQPVLIVECGTANYSSE